MSHDEVHVDLRKVMRILWDRRIFVGSITVVGLIIGVIIALAAKPVFRSEVLLAPNEGGSTMGLLAGAGGPLGGLADMAGIYARPGMGNRALAVAVLQSRVLLGQFVRENDLLPVIFADLWDEEARQWKVDDPEEVPTPLDAYDVITKSVLTVYEDKKTGFIKVGVEWTDPALAYAWVTDLIKRTNQYLKQQALNESEGNLKYLERRAQESRAVELKQATYNLIETELKKQMMAMSAEEYALRIVDPPVQPRKRIRPRRKMIVAISGMIACSVAMALVFAHAAWFGGAARRI